LTALVQADAFRTVQSDPRAALTAADAELASSDDDRPSTRWAMARWLRGMALRELSDPAEAIAAFESARDEARRAGDCRLAARIMVSLALVLAQTGQFDQAMSMLDGAQPDLLGSDLAEALGQRALIRQRAGRFEEAIGSWGPAIAAFRAAGDGLSEAKALANRGIANTYVGNFGKATADLDAAETRFRDQRAALRAAEVVHNRGFVASRLGDVPTALRLFDQAQRELGGLGISAPAALVDRVETLLSAGLAGEALEIAETAAVQLETAGLHTDLAELSLLAARAAEEVKDLPAARRWAARAFELFSAQDRPRWRALARFATIRVAHDQRTEPEGDVDLAAVQAELMTVGWPTAAFDVAVLRINALARLDAGRARAILEAARPLAVGLPASSRAQLWAAEAAVRRAEGRRAAAFRAVRSGVRLLEMHQASFGAAELRVRAGARVEEVAEIGASMALETKAAREVFAWLERGRAGSLLRPAPFPPSDEETAAALTRSRHVAALLEDEAIDERQRLRLNRQLAALEELVRRRSRHLTGHTHRGGHGPTHRPTNTGRRVPTRPSASTSRSFHHVQADVARTMGAGRLLAFGAVDGALVRVAVTGGRWSVARCGSLSEALTTVEALRHALVERLSGPRPSPPTGHIVTQLAAHAQQLFLGQRFHRTEPCAEPADGLVIVPGPLQAMPWAALPGLANSPFTVSPSAGIWLTARQQGDIPGAARVLVAAGPGLRNAARETTAIAEAHPSPLVLTGARATVNRVLHALERSDIAHVACHGSFRADNAQFSSLRLADGPLSAHELSAIRHCPRLCVLSACDLGLADANGAGALGMAASLLTGGASAVLASVLPADDVRTASLMATFHQRLVAGEPAAVALTQARRGLDDPVFGCGFTLYGASLRIGTARR
jgi:hypothetical protein